MPPDEYGALVSYITDSLGFECWLNREPEQTDVSQRKLPYVVVEGRFKTEWNQNNNTKNDGDVTVSCYAVGNTAVLDMASQVKTLFGDCSTWESIPIQAAVFSEVSLQGFQLFEEEFKDQDGQVVFRYEIYFFASTSRVQAAGG